MPKFSISYTVKNESRILPAAIDYHLRAGCEKIYIFLDGTTDNTLSILPIDERIEILETKAPSNDESLPGWIADLLPKWHINMDVRKRINTYTAVEMCERAGIEWLISIDPDELILPKLDSKDIAKDLYEFLNNIPSGVDQVLLNNVEGQAETVDVHSPFSEVTLFYRRFPWTELMWRSFRFVARKILRSSRTRAWLDYAFFYVRFRGAVSRVMTHPDTSEKIPAAYFNGYMGTKALIRVKTAKYFAPNIHEWNRFTRTPKTLSGGYVLHYHLYDAVDFLHKFRQRNAFMLVKEFYFLYSIARIARELEPDKVRRFYSKYFVLNDVERISKLLNSGVLIRIESVREFLEQHSTDPEPVDGRAPEI